MRCRFAPPRALLCQVAFQGLLLLAAVDVSSPTGPSTEWVLDSVGWGPCGVTVTIACTGPAYCWVNKESKF